jgi:ABC-type multidrug transport system fused ATPase/permease subunit
MFLFAMAGTMLGPLEQLASSWIAFDEASVAFTRYHELLALPAEPRTPPPDGREIRGGLRLHDVSFGYRPDKPILRKINLELEPGASLALVGESGAGKSTLLSLLAGLYLPDGGRLLVDGVDFREVGLPRLRESTGVVFQSPHLFDATIEENIRMGHWGATMEEVRAAARLAHADDFIMRFPERYRTPVRNRGLNLSGGQVQRIALARALVCRPRILLLDEATGNLDVHTEAAIWATLARNDLGCTRLFVTHRLSTTFRMDRIAVMDRGEILEIGTYRELLSREGPFRRLWERQTAPEGTPA